MSRHRVPGTLGTGAQLAGMEAADFLFQVFATLGNTRAYLGLDNCSFNN